jgi:hypothetical protein
MDDCVMEPALPHGSLDTRRLVLTVSLSQHAKWSVDHYSHLRLFSSGIGEKIFMYRPEDTAWKQEALYC